MTGEQLKKSILKQAIEGKLCKQDPADEPADALLARIRAEKRKLFKEGKLKKSAESRIYKGDDGKWRERVAGRKQDAEIDVPFELPAGWTWARLGEVAELYTGNSINATEKQKKYAGLASGYNYIGTKDVGFDNSINYENGIKIPFDQSGFKVAREGMPLLCIEGGSAGRKIGFLQQDVCFGNKLCAFDTLGVHSKYFYYYLQSPVFTHDFMDAIVGIIGGVSINKLKNFLIPLPPLAEQRRIACKMERLEPLIAEFGRLERELSKIEGELLPKLKKSILKQAIEGKLVRQDPADEPADALLERIRAEKRKLFKEGKLKKYTESRIYRGEDGKWRERVAGRKQDAEVAVPFELPAGWAWARLGEVVLFNPRNSLPDDTEVSFVDMKAISEGFGSRFTEQARLWKDVKQGFTHFQDGDVGFAKITPCFQNRKSVIFTGLRNGHGAGTTELHVLRAIKGTILVEYLLIFVKSPYLIEYGQSKFTGTAGQKRFSTKAAQSALIPLPPLPEQRRIADKVAVLFAAIDSVDGGGASTEQAGQSH